MAHTHEDYEPIPGLPEDLPEDEVILWQGKPTMYGIARRVFAVRGVTIWFLLLMVWTITAGLADGQSALIVFRNSSILLIPMTAALSVLLFLSNAVASTTVYTITNKRLVVRAGVAILKSINIPFKSIAAAALKINKDGSADIPVAIVPDQRIAYLMMWPHVKLSAFKDVQPMIRGIKDGRRVARILSNALAHYHGTAPVVNPVINSVAGSHDKPTEVSEAPVASNGLATHR